MAVSIRNKMRELVLSVQYFVFTKIFKMDIHPSAKISFGAKIDKTYPEGIHIGKESYVASGAIVFSHDYARAIKVDTRIGKRCFIGANAIIMAGVTIGDEVIVGSGAVVTKNVPSHTIVAGNPARVIREEIKTQKYGQLVQKEIS
ncbi:acyltransferase [Sulfuricurvum sp.]|uniref:acyltransferase n=1 Tax=Sulfuricurvum sp. TaxID=2025608 RepID=UPI003C7129B8